MDEDDEPRHAHLRARRRRCLTPTMWYFLVVIHILIAFTGSAQSQVVTASSVSKIGDELSRHLSKTFKDATKWEDIIRVYNKLTEPEIFKPKTELERIKKQIEDYLRERGKMAEAAKFSLESNPVPNHTADELNNDDLSTFVRYINAKTGSDETVTYLEGRSEPKQVNKTVELEMVPNVNFYGVPTSSDMSAIHVPTPVYNRNAELLNRIEWSQIDQLYRRNREKLKDLSFQKFCSASGFMRYFPAAPWIYDNPLTQLDLFDCRNTEWYIDAGTNSKNMIIMLDMSGSMLGQRFEIAKQTIEAILDTLSDNDFVNIMSFSKVPTMLEKCPLVQATMRNKKLLRERLNYNVTSEGKAEYEKALGHAFKTLLDLPGNLTWISKEELAKQEQSQEINSSLRYVALEDGVLVLSNDQVDAIRNDTRQPQMGCNDVIMLITDGAPGYYKETFELWNPKKTVRFFSFLIGEEAIDFDQVKWMACRNRGYMVHVSNMADVQEKVQHYVGVLSRPISRLPRNQTTTAIWGSVTKERMSNQYVISVGYPVVVNATFMGVAAVSLPIIELIQIAHPSTLGSNSYFFMLDNNGYAMFHPQLRPIDTITGETKPTYNNMDFLDVEVQRRLSELEDIANVNCDNSTTTKMSVLYAINDMKRVYPQRNYYIFECISGTHFTIGAAIAEGDDVRLKRRQRFHYKDVELRWFEEKNWRIHPEWRYCILNDSDTSLSAEAAITTYARQMRAQGKLPTLCQPRKELVDRLLLDLEASNSFADLWDQEWQANRKNGVHLSFFAAPSGLIRYFNESLEDAWYYEEEDFTLNHTDKAYKHFILELNKRSSDDDYYKRAVRMKGKIVFDVNLQTYLWQATEALTAYGTDENQTMLAVAYKALYHDQALIGVVGMEFLYDKVVDWLKTHGCDPNSTQVRCFLLDENAYIYYSSQRDINYEGTLKEHEYSQKNRRYVKNSPIGRFFGHLNRATEWTMEMLVKKGFYKNVTFVDNQAMCDKEDKPKNNAAAVITVPLTHLKNIILWTATQLLQVLAKYAVFIVTSMFSTTVPSANGYTSTFKTSAGNRQPCQTESPFYIADTEHTKMASASLLEGDSAERPCMQNAAQCAIRVYAHWIEKTNLLLVVISQDEQSSCYDETMCPKASPSPVPFTFTKMNKTEDRLDSTMSATEATLNQGECQNAMSTQRKNVIECVAEEIVDESEYDCSNSPSLHSTSILAVLATVFLSLFVFA